MMSIQTKIVGIRAAAREFSEWIGPAIIYYNPETGSVYTTTLFDENSSLLIEGDDPTITVHSKFGWRHENDKITMAALKQQIYDLTS